MGRTVAFGTEEAPTETRGVIGIFCRPNHPVGWGSCAIVSDVHLASAHGYVTLMVISPSWEHHDEVKLRLVKGDFDGTGAVSPWGQDDSWFRGPFECVFAFDGAITDLDDGLAFGPYAWHHPRWGPASFGDNRMFGLYTYEQAMEL